MVAASITAFAMWGYIGVSLIVMWFVWLGLASTVRYAMARVYRRRQPSGDDAAKWENYFCLASALVGAGWGLALMLVGHTPTSLQELTVTFLISSVAMGLPPSLAPSPKAFTSFILPILAPMVAMLLTFGGGLNTSTALLMLVFATVLLGLYLSNHYALIETLAYGHENTLLLKKLRVAEKSLTSALAEQQLIFDTAAVGIAFVSQGAVVKCNRRFAEILGYAIDEIAGQSASVWLQKESNFLQPGSRALALLAQGANYSAELRLHRK
ncbi:MAG: PAS domain-containing protein, partial [Betaproteobacteria bacterium]|nr:PAS domain-containing protein [Betaproteobacteria bacterium]